MASKVMRIEFPSEIRDICLYTDGQNRWAVVVCLDYSIWKAKLGEFERVKPTDVTTTWGAASLKPDI